MPASKTYIYSEAPFSNCCRKVVQMADGRFLEVRRDDVTWTAAFRAANPGFKQFTYGSLHHWHESIPHNLHSHVAAWKMSRGWAAPPPAEEGETRYWLDIHLSMFMGVAAATEEQLAEAVVEFSNVYPDSTFLTFLLGDNPYEVITRGDILGELDKNGHILPEPAYWPGMCVWKKKELPKLQLAASGEFQLSPELTYFLERDSGSWESVLKAFRAYGIYEDMHFHDALREAGIDEDVRTTGYIFADMFVRTFFGLDDGGKGFLTFSDFRRQMLERGHLVAANASAAPPSLLVVDLNVATGSRTVAANASVYSQTTAEAEDDDSASELSSIEESDDSDYVPSDTESESSDMDIDEGPGAKKDPETLKREAYKLVDDTLAYADRKFAEFKTQEERKKSALKLVEDTLAYAKRWQEEHCVKEAVPAVANPFEEIDATFSRGDAIVTDVTVGRIYRQILAQQFATYCLRPEFKDLWTSHAFERIQMRASLTYWLEQTVIGEDSQATNAIKAFLKAYPA